MVEIPAEERSHLQETHGTLLREVLDEELGGLNAAAWQHLRSSVLWKQLSAGEILCLEGDEADAMYVVVSGRLRATRDENGQPRVVGEITRGETVGEMALLTGKRRSATVQAMRDCVLAGLDSPTFAELARLCPEAILHITRVQFERIERANRPHGTRLLRLSIALLPATHGSDASALAARLQDEIARHCQVVTARRDAAPGNSANSPGDRKARLAIWLNELEASAPVLLMPCDRNDAAWTQQCLYSADIALILVPAGQQPDLAGDAIPSSAKRMLVMLHSDGAKAPENTAAIRKACDAGAHFHLRENSFADLSRLARLLTGRAVGISFAGGGARSFSHLGVLRALEEHGIPIDVATGTSLGAIIAAGVSLDIGLDDLIERFRIMARANPTKRDYRLIPKTSLLTGRKLDRLLSQLLPDTDIEDCWKNFACVSANITNPGAHLHNGGKLLHALRATVSIPGVFPPATLPGGDLLVDGGVVNNLPADLARDAGAGRLIACDQGGNGGGTDKPSAMSIIMRAATLHSRISGSIWKSSADLYFESPVSDISLLEWDRIDLAIKRGHDNAAKILQDVNPADWQ